MTNKAELSIREAAEALCVDQMLVRIADIALKSKEVKYNHYCRRKYLNKAKYAQHSKEPHYLADRTKTHI